MPEHIRSDNGSEFAAYVLRKLLASLEMKTLFIEPGSPWENGHEESFKGKMRDELLNREVMDTLWEARILCGKRVRQYTAAKPHNALGYGPPAAQARIPQSLGQAVFVT
jgi:transposase InsO family protein